MSKKNAIKRNAMLWLLVICSSVLLSIPFLYPHLGLVSLVGFVPLFAAEKIATENNKRFFGIYYYIGFLLWNLFTTYWIYNATMPGMIAAVMLNALQMAVIFRLFRWFKTLTKGFLPYIFFIITWIAWEHAYFTWEISWPWLVLGNAFSTSIKCIQWYEYTGALGGSLWVLLL
jgi:apolipoprotein N-acyltransferase